MIDAPISDTALRLYCVLLRYGNTTGHRMPSRATLAARLHKKSTDTIDRALRELEALGALAVEHRATGTGRALTNRYHLLTARPGTDQAGARAPQREGRTDAAAHQTEQAQPPAPTPPPTDRDGRTDAAPTGRTTAATVAAPIGQDRNPSTQTPPHPIPSETDPTRDDPVQSAPAGDAEVRLLDTCGITNLRALIGQLHDHRRHLARPITPWSRGRVLAALDTAVTHHGWPPDQAARALLAVAADRHTTSPMRLTAPGPWWNTRPEVRPSGSARAPVAPRPDPAVAERGVALAWQLLNARPERTSTSATASSRSRPPVGGDASVIRRERASRSTAAPGPDGCFDSGPGTRGSDTSPAPVRLTSPGETTASRREVIHPKL